ncbi:hypothetical protein SDC9_105027 [bioreactor metagenome]|uniref:Uncharacterized protein n=1 Tax=bioreactor metagenome TaxID=1076179 RepID=A0A645AYF7_9ZZZZ
MKLVGGGGAESIRRAEEDPLALGLHAAAQLADGGGFPHAVHADEQHHGGLLLQAEGRVAHVQHLRQNLPQGGAHRCFAGDALPLHFGPKPLHRLGGGVHAQIRQNQALLQIVKKRLVVGGNGIAGDVLLPDFFQFAEKAHSTRPLIK